MSLSSLFWQKSKYQEILKLSIPLVLSSSGIVIMQFIDGVFLAWHSSTELAAVGSSGCTSWLLQAIVLGIVGYTSALTANLVGAGMEKKVGSAIWQGLYISLGGSVLCAILSLFTLPFFTVCGHVHELASAESTYLKIILLGAVFNFGQTAISGFFSGRGDNVRLMVAQILGQISNIIGDYLLIFGKFGFPEMGIAGAAIATVLSALVPFVILAYFALRKENRVKYHTWEGRAFNWEMFKNMAYFGVPNGLQQFVDAGIWTVFVIIVGKIGVIESAATTICFRLNSIALLPVWGIARAASTFVGQSHGRKDHQATIEYACHSAVLCQAWMTTIAITYFLFPVQYFSLFDSGQEQSAELLKVGAYLLKFVAIYCLADSLNGSLMSTLHAVGDTVWTFWVMCGCTVVLSIVLLVADHFHMGLTFIWSVATFYVMILPPFWVVRFKGGEWKNIIVAK